MKRSHIVCIGMLLLNIGLSSQQAGAALIAEDIDGMYHAQMNNPKASLPEMKKYEDGVYEASLPFDGKYKFDAHAKITVKNGLIVDVVFWERQQDTDRLKGKAYIESETKVWGESWRAGVTAAVAGMRQYPGRLIAAQDIDKVDAVSGATYSYKKFVQVVKMALTDALAKN